MPPVVAEHTSTGISRALTAERALAPLEPFQPSRAPLRDARPPARLGIIGGGQLAKMTAQAAGQLGCEVQILESDLRCPAAAVCPRVWPGDWRDSDALLRMASSVDVVTLENEFVSPESLRLLEDAGYEVYPSADTMALVQDKLRQKETFAAAGLAVPRFRAVQEPSDVLTVGAEFGWPLVLKKRRNGYDGRGNATIHSPEEVMSAWRRLGGAPGELYVEEFFPFRSELAVIVTRGRDGSMVTYPVVESVQRDHVCHTVTAPAAVSDAVGSAALGMARTAVEAISGVGSFGIEFFLGRDGRVVLNEIAPRVHNTGHYTIEACECSQFENHVRAVLGWPLGSTRMRKPAAAMVNLLGTSHGPGAPRGLAAALQKPGAHVHLYGKAISAPGRKLGHVTALGDSAGAALETALSAARELRFGE